MRHRLSNYSKKNNSNQSTEEVVMPLVQRNNNADSKSLSPTRPSNAATTSASQHTHTGNSVSSSTAAADDADIAAGALDLQGLLSSSSHHQQSSGNNSAGQQHHSSLLKTVESAPSSVASTFSTMSTSKDNASNAEGELEFFEDLVSEPVLVLGMDISHLSRTVQFIVCAVGVFFFSLLYGFLQELISVELCSRKLGLFLAQVQFSGYTILAYILRQFVYEKEKKARTSKGDSKRKNNLPVPLLLYLGLSLLRAVDLGMTNLAMQYINYPAKTLMKSSRVVFTMLFGVVISRKAYKPLDYVIVFAMVAGLAIFMHADANSSAVFHHIGVIMLTISLICDGAITNMSESIMSEFGVGQDEFIFRMYSIALVAITLAAAYKGDLSEGMMWLSQPGTYNELALPISERTWSVPGKIFCLFLFSSMGFFGSSCAAAITKQFGALTMSITSTARKATTLFVSFLFFNNVCTKEHIAGMAVFISALTAKSLRRRNDKHHKKKHHGRKKKDRHHAQLPLTMIDTIEIAEITPSRSSDEITSNQMIRRTASGTDGGGETVALIDRDGPRYRDIHVV